MRRLPSSWDKTLTSLGFVRKPQKRGKASREQIRIESLEPRQMLAGDTLGAGVQQAEWVATNWNDESYQDQYLISTEINTNNDAIAVISLNPEIEKLNEERHEVTLELRRGEEVIATQHVSIDLAEEDFRDRFLADRVLIASEAVPEADAGQIEGLVRELGRSSTLGDLLSLGESLLPQEIDQFLSETTNRVATLAKDLAKDAKSWSRGDRMSLYQATSSAIADSASRWSQEAEDQLGNTLLLLGDQLKSDLGSGDFELENSASALRSAALATLPSYYTLFTNFATNDVLGSQSNGGSLTTIASVEAASVTLNDAVRFEFGDLYAVVDSTLESSSLPMFYQASSIAVANAEGDSFALENYPTIAFGDSSSSYDGFLYVQNSPSSGAGESYLQFDLSGQSGKHASDAALKLETISVGIDTPHVILSAHRDLFGLTSSTSFDEQTFTYNDRGTVFGDYSSDYDDNFSDPLATWDAAVGVGSYDVSEAVQRALMAGDSNLNGTLELNGSKQGDVEAFYLAVHDWDRYVDIYGSAAVNETDLLYANDINWDGLVNHDDWESMKERWGLAKGDVSLDGATNSLDWSRLQSNYGLNTKGLGLGGYLLGDANFNGVVDTIDFGLIDLGMDQNATSTTPLNPSLTFRLTAQTGPDTTTASFASAENTSGYQIPELSITHDADIEVTDFSTFGTDLFLRYSIYNHSFSNAEAKVYRVPFDGTSVADGTLLMTQSVTGSIGQHELQFAADFGINDDTQEDYRLVVEITGTPSSGAESDLADNERQFAGGVFVEGQSGNIHVHGSDQNDTVQITNNGIELTGQKAIIFGYGTGETTFVDDDGVANGWVDSREHSTGSFDVTGSFANPNTYYAYTWGNDRVRKVLSNDAQSANAVWEFANLAAGTYLVSTNWQASGTSSSQATYRIYDGDRLVQWDYGKQYHLPEADHTETHSQISGSIRFEDIGKPVTVTSGTLRVELANDLTKAVIGDAVRLERIDVTKPASIDTVYIRGQQGDDLISASQDLSFSITAFGGNGEDLLVGGAQGDTLVGGMGADSLAGMGGNDTLVGSQIITANQAAVLDDGSDTFDGGEGIDTLHVDYDEPTGIDPYKPSGGDFFPTDTTDSIDSDNDGIALAPTGSVWQQELLWNENYGFGDGWNLPGLERLEYVGAASNPTALYWIRSDGHKVTFDRASTNDPWVAVSGDVSASEIVYNDTTSKFVQTDKYGAVSEYEIAATELAMLTKSVDRLGIGYEYTYSDEDNDGNATEIKSVSMVRPGQIAEVTHYSYQTMQVGGNTFRRVRTISDSFGAFARKVTLSYDSSGRIEQIELPGTSVGHTYANLGLMVDNLSKTALVRATTTFEYSGDFISRVDEPDNYISGSGDIKRDYTWQYDGQGVRTELHVEDADPHPVRYLGAPSDVYMTWAKVTGKWKDFLPAFLLTDGVELLTAGQTKEGYAVDEAGRTTMLSYDHNGEVVEKIEPSGARNVVARNSAGQIVTIERKAAGDDRTVDYSSFSYDADFNQLSATYYDGTSDSWNYGAFAQISSYTDELGRKRLFEIDTQTGNVTESRTIIGSDDRNTPGEDDDLVTTFTYESDGLLKESVEFRNDIDGTAQNSLVTRYEYTTVDDSGPDFIGRWLVSTSYGGDDPNVSGIPLTLIDQATVMVTSRDAYGNATGVSDEMGRITTFAYDAMDRLRQQVSPDPGNGQPTMRIDYTYSARGRQLYKVEGASEDVEALNVKFSQNIPLYNADSQGGSGSLLAFTGDYFEEAGEVGQSDDATVKANDYDSCDCPTEESLDCDGEPSKTGTAFNPTGHPNTYTGSSQQQTTASYGCLPGKPVKQTSNARYPSASHASANPPGSSQASTELSEDAETYYQYNARGELVAEYSSGLLLTRYSYDPRGRLTEVVGGLGTRTTTRYNSAGEVVSVTDGEGRTTAYSYDDAGRIVKQEQADGAANRTTYEYDTASNLRKTTDQQGNTSENTYDERGRVTVQTDQNSDSTTFTYYADNQRHTLTDANSNTTTWTYDDAGRLASETNELGKTESYTYDGFGNLQKVIDRLGRKITYAYDGLHNLDVEKWYADDASTTAIGVIDYDYDVSTRLEKVTTTLGGQQTHEYDYVYDALDRAASKSIAFDSIDVDFSVDFDPLRRVTSSRLTLGGLTDDLENTFTYDTAGRVSSITQAAQDAAARPVAEKHVELRYNQASQFSNINRFAAAAAVGTAAVSSSNHRYDQAGRLTTLAHNQNNAAGALFAGYAYAYSNDSDLLQMDFLPDGTDPLYNYSTEDVSFGYDNRNQLTSTTDTGTLATEESYAYDSNGNRVGSQTNNTGTNNYAAAGTNNQLLNDGTFIYTYDYQGNRDTKTRIATDASSEQTTEYSWDHRNRLTKVTFRNNSDDVTKTVEYTYDAFNQLIKTVVDVDGDLGTTAIEQTAYVHDDGQVVMQFDKTGSGSIGDGDLSHRYLWGPAVDQLLADETVNLATSSEGTNLWALADHLGTVRDLVDDTGALQNHKSYDAFGNVTDETNAAIDTAFGYTGKLFDEDTKLQNNLNRWYDAKVGKWISEDPIGFTAGDSNLDRYVDNQPTVSTDPTGLITAGIGYGVDVSVAGHIAFEIDLTVGWDPSKGSNGFSASVSCTAQVGPGIGLGVGVGPHITTTTAPHVDDLNGAGQEWGVWLGGGQFGSGGAGITNDVLGWVDWAHQILLGTPQSWNGTQIAVPLPGCSMGGGFGFFDDKTATQPLITIDSKGVDILPGF